MTEELLGRGDPVIRRLQQAFADEEPATDLAAVMQRAARYQAGEPPGAHDPPPGHGLTQADLVAARRREPAAVTRVYTAYAPALFRFFMASVGDRHLAEDLTGTTFVSAIEGLPRFRGPVEALGGWLFQIARHDLYDFRRRQARSRIEPLEDDLGEAAAPASTLGVLGRDPGTETAFWSDQTHPPGAEPVVSAGAGDPGPAGQAAGPTGASPKSASCRSTPSAPTCRTSWSSWACTPSSRRSAFALEHGWTSGPEDLDPLAMEGLEGTPASWPPSSSSPPTSARC